MDGKLKKRDFSRRSPFRSQKLSPQLYRAVTYVASNSMI